MWVLYLSKYLWLNLFCCCSCALRTLLSVCLGSTIVFSPNILLLVCFGWYFGMFSSPSPFPSISPHPSPSHYPSPFSSFPLSKTNIIKVWYSNIHIPCSVEGDISLFFNKNYADNLRAVSNAKDIMNIVDKIIEPIKSMTNINKEHTMEYIQNLTNFSKVYATV